MRKCKVVQIAEEELRRLSQHKDNQEFAETAYLQKQFQHPSSCTIIHPRRPNLMMMMMMMMMMLTMMMVMVKLGMMLMTMVMPTVMMTMTI